MKESLKEALDLIDQGKYYEAELVLEKLIVSEDKQEKALANYYMYVVCKGIGKENSSRLYLSKFFEASLSYHYTINGYSHTGEFNISPDDIKSFILLHSHSHSKPVDYVFINNPIIWLLTDLLTTKLLQKKST